MTEVSLLATRRIAAYGVAVRDGHILLARASGSSDFPGTWSLPGGGVDHGEHPRATVAREYVEETSLQVEVGATPEVFSDVAEIPGKGILLHSVRFCYPVEVVGGTLRDEIGGSTDHVEWVPLDQALTLPPIAPFVTEVLEEEAVRASARALA
jgi:ADP-ribose pyrophosphatase YjhB (NUDIX family)